MAVTLTVADLLAALRMGESDAETAEGTRLLTFATLAITKHAPAAPDPVQNEAAIRLCGYLFDQPFATRGTTFANAGRNSGAWAVLLPYRVHRAGPIGASPRSSTSDGLLNPVVGHRNYLGIRSADALFVAADYTVDDTSTTLTIPAYAGAMWLSFAFPDDQTISEMYLYEAGHRLALSVLSSFPTVGSVELGAATHISRSSVDALSGYGGYILEMVFA